MLSVKKLIYKILSLPMVVEEGTVGTWMYRKWSDGTAECWGLFGEKTLSISTAYGNAFYGAFQTVTFPNGLFVDRPIPSLSLRNSNGVWGGINGLSATYVSYYPFCSKSGNQTIEEEVYAIGRWK